MFPTQLQTYIYLDKYSRFDYDKGRREYWNETVTRTVNHLKKLVGDTTTTIDWDELESAIYNLEVMPSMRNLAMAGQAAERSSIVSYNCAYAPVQDILSFREAVIILMSGSGLGYSVESRYISKLPNVQKQTGITELFTVPDTSEGWAQAVELSIAAWMNGADIILDYSKIRKAGSPLKIKGGRASGGEHLKKGIDKIREVIFNRQLKKLRSIDVHDVMCYIAEAIVSGGVRRSAMIALFDIDDELMRGCKSGAAIIGNEQRWFANNSVVVTERLSKQSVSSLMNEMAKDGSGEPGIFSRYAANLTKPERRESCDFGTNPCGEIFLRPYEFCNLTSVVCRQSDTYRNLLQKIRIATIIGTIQSLATNFVGLRPEWEENAHRERLLGVDLNGLMDCGLARGLDTLQNMRDYAILVNAQLASELGIKASKSITCIKPSGNSSTMLDTSPGLHTRWSSYYIRRVQTDNTSPLKDMLLADGAPVERRVASDSTWVISFPVKSPDGAITRHDLNAVQQCEMWKMLKVGYTEHNPSVTITYHENEVDALIDWVYENQDILGGMAFLPSFDAEYEQMPYEEITQEQYDTAVASFPQIDWKRLEQYEAGVDTTSVATTFACTSDKCLVY